MKEFLNTNKTALMVTSITVVLAGIAVFTALRLYQLRDTQVAPTAPEQPKAEAPQSCELLTFTITNPLQSPSASPTTTPTALPSASPSTSPSPTATAIATATPTTTPTNTATPIATGQTTKPTTTATATAVSQGPTATPVLPDAGIATPAIAGIGMAALLLLAAMLLLF